MTRDNDGTADHDRRNELKYRWDNTKRHGQFVFKCLYALASCDFRQKNLMSNK